MELEILPKDIELGKKRQDYIVRKLGKDISRFIKGFPEDIKKATIRVRGGSRWGYWVTFSLFLPKKHHIFVEHKDKTFRNTVVAVKRQAERQIRDYKEKLKEVARLKK